ncbi:hypothetical protein [Phycicoccus elongatus]|nr:hypothetical protein [Phycicoccus elongatus]
MRLGFILGEIWTGLRRNLSMAVSVVLVTMVSVLFFGLGLLASLQVDDDEGLLVRPGRGLDLAVHRGRSLEPTCDVQAR